MINEKYKDIINMPHHESKNHKRMSLYNRAAQFSPFAALVGYEEAIIESGRVVSTKKELTQEEKDLISNKLQYLLDNIKSSLTIKIIYFEKDKKKDGGKYITIESKIKKIDEVNRVIKLEDNSKISIDSIIDIILPTNNCLFNE